MSVAFVQTVPFWPSTPTVGPNTSSSFTPTAGNFLLGIANDDSANTATLTLNGSVNNLTQGNKTDDAGNANSTAIFGLNSITGGAQTLTASKGSAGDFIYGAAWEFSGVDVPTYTGNIPTSVSSTLSGTAVTVPVGAILVAFIKFDTGAGNAITAQTNGGVAPTALNSGNVGSNYCAAYWAGTGGSITPTFLEAASGANTGILVQALLPPASAPANTSQGENLTSLTFMSMSRGFR